MDFPANKYFIHSKLLEKLLTSPGQSEEERALKKRFWWAVAPSIPVVGLAGIIIWFLSLPTIGMAMGIFSGFEMILLITFMIYRRKTEQFALINQYFFVIISFVGVLYFGGILNSCGLVFVGLVGALQSLFFLKPVQIRIIFIIYILTVIVEAFLQPWLIPLPEITPKANLILFVLHFLVVAFAIYTVLSFYITENIRIKEKEAKRLQELDTIKTNFYTNITHEFRTPLTVILGMCEQISKNSNKYLTTGIQLIRQNGIHLLYLVNQILDFSKLEAKSMKNHFVQMNILPFLQQTTEPFKYLAETKNIRFHFLTEIEELKMDFDIEKLNSLISNLLSNAIKHSNPNSDIYFFVSVTNEKDSHAGFNYSLFPDRNFNSEQILKIAVKDTGSGIAETELPKIFDRYYHVAQKDMKHNPGTGIGLVVVKELVDLLQGNVLVKSAKGKGSEFIVLLPIKNNAEKAAEVNNFELKFSNPANSKEKFVTKKQSLKELPHLLIIEDNDDVVTYIESITSNHYKTDRAVNGDEGIKMAYEIIPDIILSDIMMPGKNGYEVCKTLKNDFRTSHIPIILLTAKADKESQIEGISKGADAYLSKPFNTKELMVQMQTLIEFRNNLIAKYRAFAIASISEVVEPVNPDELFLKRLKEILEDNYKEDDFDTNKLTQMIGMSRVQLFRKLKALTGVSASHFIRFYRLSKAKEKITGTIENISEIAFEVGFKDPAYFTRAFNKEFGITPSSLRK